MLKVGHTSQFMLERLHCMTCNHSREGAMGSDTLQTISVPKSLAPDVPMGRYGSTDGGHSAEKVY